MNYWPIGVSCKYSNTKSIVPVIQNLLAGLKALDSVGLGYEGY